MNFKVVADYDYHKLWISTTTIPSDWPVYLLLRLEYTDDWGDDVGFKYHVSVNAVAPQALSDEKIAEVISSIGESLEWYNGLSEEAKCQLILEYGTTVPLYQQGGNNMRELLKGARKEANNISILFGFYMDRPVNAIGSTGWDWIKGEILAGLGRKD